MRQHSTVLMVLFSLILLVSGGCATDTSQRPYNPISDPDFKGPTLSTVRATPAAFPGSRVRWGGQLVAVENRRDETWLDVLGYPLDVNGRPDVTQASAGRFLVRVRGFLDPAIYAKGRPFTVVGTLEAPVQRLIGDYPYQFPVVAATTYRLWEERQEPKVIYYPDPFWDGFWGPGYPWPRYWYRHR